MVGQRGKEKQSGKGGIIEERVTEASGDKAYNLDRGILVWLYYCDGMPVSI